MTHDTPPTPWHTDPVEIDRLLDDELEADVAAARRAEIAATPALARRIATRERYLAFLLRAGTARRASLAAGVPDGLESRIRFAVARSRGAATTRLRWVAAAAAVLAVALGATFFAGGAGNGAEAMPAAVIRAAEAARAPEPGPRGCKVEEAESPLVFPPVRDGTLLVWACVDRGGETVAKLYRPEELPSVGYAAVAAPGATPGPTIGRTDLGDQVVFDIAFGRKTHYLAVNATWLERQRTLTPGRESCRACHHLSRVGKENPHDIVQRSWKLGG